METIAFELVDWESVRRDCKYPPEDNNNGYIYGLYQIDEECGDILEVEWFTTDRARYARLQECGDYKIIN